MKKRILVTMLLVLVLVLMTIGIAQAKDPLRCTIDYTFLGQEVDGRFVSWVATISGDINGTVYYFASGSPMRFTGQASHYADSWEIVDGDGNVIMAGTDQTGSSTIRHGKNSNWRTNGVVTEAYGDYADWVGRQVHQSGHFTWAAPGLPKDGTGIFRVN
jgi:hypothetical protein